MAVVGTDEIMIERGGTLYKAPVSDLPSGGGGSPAGTGTEVQFRDGASFGAASKTSIGTAGNLILASNSTQPAAPPADTLQLFGRRRAGADFIEVQRPNGRETPLGPHMGFNRIATWAPSSGTSVIASGMPRTVVGTVAHPTPGSTNLSTSIRRWRVTSAALITGSSSDERAPVKLCFRGNAAGLGGWTYTNRISLATLQASANGFFGMLSSTSALAVTQEINTLTNCIGFGFTNGVDTNWQVIHNDESGTVTKVDMGADFPVSNFGNVYTFFIYAEANGSFVGMRAVNETTGIDYEVELTTNIPASTTFLSVRNYMNNGATVAATVAYDCSGVYLETDY